MVVFQIVFPYLFKMVFYDFYNFPIFRFFCIFINYMFFTNVQTLNLLFTRIRVGPFNGYRLTLTLTLTLGRI
jgi:hypothetical protein